MAQAAKQAKPLPPMLKQYLEIKDEYPDSLLFFQVGDFYELFFEDAVTVARSLNLTLTSRDKNSENPVPMCGVPLAVVDGYIDRIVDLGFSAAVVSQAEEKPKKGMVARKLQRIVTPAVRLHGGAESKADAGILASVYLRDQNEAAVAFSNVQTGEINVQEGLALAEVGAFLGKIAPIEVILPRTVDGKTLSRRFSWIKDLERRYSEKAIKFRSYDNFGRDVTSLGGYGGLGADGKGSVRLLLGYIDESTVEHKIPITRVIACTAGGALEMDPTSRANLELTRTLRRGTREGSLLDYMDLTLTPGGGRQLRSWLLAPLVSKEGILKRQDALAFLLESFFVREKLRDGLKHFSDLERIAARLEMGIVSPRELAVLRDSLLASRELQAELPEEDGLHSLPDLLAECKSQLDYKDLSLFDLLARLAESPPLTQVEGGIIKQGVDDRLDELLSIRRDGRSFISELEGIEREKTGIPSLKIRFNNVIGYFFEVTKTHVDKVPEYFIRRQGMANAERFTTEELKEREDKIVTAKDKQIRLERELFQELKDELLAFTNIIRQAHMAVSSVDVLVSLAELAARDSLVRPKLEENTELDVEDGLHPVLAKQLEGAFVPNSIRFGEQSDRCLILTGPNMGGKSTYLRQAALITIMAQMGSFVAAKRACIGLVDKIFARLGASDDMAEGDSTFMVEMREASHIVAQASARSLVLIDEIGRGTATTDGLAIAQAILEWAVSQIGCRTLFATHFHELTHLSNDSSNISNISVGSVDRGGEVVFTHQIRKGPANKSYGIEVARLAGLPPEIISRSRELLLSIEKERGGASSSQLDLFQVHSESESTPPQLVDSAHQAKLEVLVEQIVDFNINESTPIDALQKIASLQKQVAED